MWQTLSIEHNCSSFTYLCVYFLKQVFLIYIHLVKSVQDISIFWKILLFSPLEVVITVYLQLSEDIAFLYKLEMPLHITFKQTELTKVLEKNDSRNRGAVRLWEKKENVEFALLYFVNFFSIVFLIHFKV